jgi:hypothetical protein
LQSLIYGAAIAFNTFFAMHWINDFATDRTWSIITTYFLGAVIAFLVCAFIIRLLLGWLKARSWPVRIILVITLVTGATIGITALLYALEYREFYAKWHSEAFSRIWFFEQAFTILVAFYQFAVLGIRFYLPLAPLILILTSSILLRSTR